MNKIDTGLLILGAGLIVIGIWSYLYIQNPPISIGTFPYTAPFQIFVMTALGLALVFRSVLRDLGNEDNGV
jgi:hypothetical protein